jgi:hypothetical protein
VYVCIYIYIIYYSTKYYSTTFCSWRLLPKYVHSFSRTTHDRQLFLGQDRSGSSVHDLLRLTNKAKLSSGWSVMIHWPEHSWKWVHPIQSQNFLGWYLVLFKTKGPRERIVSYCFYTFIAQMVLLVKSSDILLSPLPSCSLFLSMLVMNNGERTETKTGRLGWGTQ